MKTSASSRNLPLNFFEGKQSPRFLELLDASRDLDCSLDLQWVWERDQLMEPFLKDHEKHRSF